MRDSSYSANHAMLSDNLISKCNDAVLYIYYEHYSRGIKNWNMAMISVNAGDVLDEATDAAPRLYLFQSLNHTSHPWSR